MRKFLKIYTVAGILFTIGVGSLAHFIYQWTGENPAAALFVPVNESTWEHMKMLFYPMLLLILIGFIFFEHQHPGLLFAATTGLCAGLAAIPFIFYTNATYARKRGKGFPFGPYT